MKSKNKKKDQKLMKEELENSQQLDNFSLYKLFNV